MEFLQEKEQNVLVIQLKKSVVQVFWYPKSTLQPVEYNLRKSIVFSHKKP